MKTEILSEKSYFAEMNRIGSELQKLRTAGTFARKSGEDIYYELYQRPEAKGWVALSHGFVESSAKYAELIWYFVEEGYHVAICDHRGHGNSYRQVKELWLTHVEQFTDYVDDYAYFLREIVIPKLDGLPLYFMGHSMGGAIAALTTERNPDLPIKKLILSCPMIAPQTMGIPRWLSLMMTRFFILIGRGNRCLFNQRIFTGEEDFDSDWCCATSYNRYLWYLGVQRENEKYQNNAATYRWAQESMLVGEKILKPEHLANLTMPVLLLQAGHDTMVENGKQDELISKVSNGRIVRFPTAKHEIFRSEDKVVKEFMETIFHFIEESHGESTGGEG